MACAFQMVLSGATSHIFGRASLPNAQVWSRSAFFWQRKGPKVQDNQHDRKKINQLDGPTAAVNVPSMKNKSAVLAVPSYSPPTAVTERVQVLTEQLVGELSQDWQSTSLQDRRLKFKLLSRCKQEFSHMVPSHCLVAMETVRDVVHFYQTPAQESYTLERLSRHGLPLNLHVQPDPLRFHPDTDSMFEGRSAYPDQATVVQSIKHCHKYRGTKTE